MRSALVPLFAILAAGLLSSGCTLIRVPGPRPLKRSEVAEVMPDLTPERAHEWRESILDDPESEKYIHRRDTYGYAIYGRHGPVTPLLVGQFKLERHMQPTMGSGNREIIEQKDWRGLLSPALYSDYRIAYFDVKSGRAVFASELIGITPLLAWGSTIGPDGKWNEVPRAVIDGGVTLEKIRYQQESAVYILGGALAFGSHNRTPFIQILWIQIPLGSGLE